MRVSVGSKHDGTHRAYLFVIGNGTKQRRIGHSVITMRMCLKNGKRTRLRKRKRLYKREGKARRERIRGGLSNGEHGRLRVEMVVKHAPVSSIEPVAIVAVAVDDVRGVDFLVGVLTGFRHEPAAYD